MVIETPQDMAELIRECVRTTYQYIDRCNKEFDLHLPYYDVKFDMKGTSGGTACISKNIIRFNPTLLRRNPETFLKQTVGHEVAHFVAYHKYKDRGHGEKWYSVMRRLGLEEKRCHSYDTSLVPNKVGKVPNKPGAVFKIALGEMRMIPVGRMIEFD